MTEQDKQDLRLKLFCIKDSDDEIKVKIDVTDGLKVLLKSLTINENVKIDITNFDIFNSLDNSVSIDLRNYNRVRTTATQEQIDNTYSKKRQNELNTLNEKTNIDRYKVKSAFYNSMRSDYKQILFIKKLIDTGSVELKIYQLGTLDNFSEGLKNCIADIFKGLKNLNFKQEIILKPMDKGEFKDLDKALKHSVKEYEKKKKEQDDFNNMREKIDIAIGDRTYTDDDDITRCDECEQQLTTYRDGSNNIRCRGCERIFFNRQHYVNTIEEHKS